MSKRAGGGNTTVTRGLCVGYLHEMIEGIKSYKPEVKASKLDKRLRSYGHSKFCMFSYWFSLAHERCSRLLNAAQTPTLVNLTSLIYGTEISGVSNLCLILNNHYHLYRVVWIKALKDCELPSCCIKECSLTKSCPIAKLRIEVKVGLYHSQTWVLVLPWFADLVPTSAIEQVIFNIDFAFFRIASFRFFVLVISLVLLALE